MWKVKEGVKLRIEMVPFLEEPGKNGTLSFTASSLGLVFRTFRW